MYRGPLERSGSQLESKAFVAGGYRAFAERRDPDTLDGELLDSIRTNSRSYNPLYRNRHDFKSSDCEKAARSWPIYAGPGDWQSTRTGCQRLGISLASLNTEKL